MSEIANVKFSRRREQRCLEGMLQKAYYPKILMMVEMVFLEIRAGTGGDESTLFAGELLRMYLKYAEKYRWSARLFHKMNLILADTKKSW
jgi:peptide chain release factor 1